MQELILFILFMIPIVILIICMMIRIVKHKQINDTNSLSLITEDYVANLGDDKKDVLEKSYSVYHHNIAIYFGYIAFFFSIFSIVIGFYDDILQNIKDTKNIDEMTRYLFYLIASLSFTFFIFIYLNMINTYMQILNSRRLIDLIEQQEKQQYYKLFENGYYSTTSNVVTSLNIFNFIILIISSLIVLYGLINSVDTIRDAYIIFYTTIIMIFICALIVNKNIHKRIPKQKKNKDKNK